MKKFFTLSTGIVFLIAILSAGGCKPKRVKPTGDFKKVTITINKSVKINGKNYLYMSDPKNKNVIDSLLFTYVKPGTIILWKLKTGSGIKEIEEIYPTTGKHNIFKENPKKKFLSKTFKYIVPDAAVPGEEKYAIDFMLEDDTEDSVDPYIRI